MITDEHIDQLARHYDKTGDFHLLLKRLRSTEAKLKEAIEFILWVSPCGQTEENPTYKLIGETARECFDELKK